MGKRRLRAAPSTLAAARVVMPELARGSARQRGYSAAWDRASLAYLAANPLCLGCKALGRTEPATVTDHVVPHRGDRRLFWDPANRQPSCDWHHNEVKQRLELLYTLGQATADDLRLDSARAVALARERRGGGSDP